MCFHGPNPQLKNSGNLPSRLPCFQGVEMEKGRCQQFSTIFGDVLDPPSHSEHQKKKFGGPPRIFQKRHPKWPFFGVASLGSETPSLDSETQKRLVFLGLTNMISRTKGHFKVFLRGELRVLTSTVQAQTFYCVKVLFKRLLLLKILLQFDVKTIARRNGTQFKSFLWA